MEFHDESIDLCTNEMQKGFEIRKFCISMTNVHFKTLQSQHVSVAEQLEILFLNSDVQY